MANTFELIASSTVGSGGAASIDFSSIPATYTDLVMFGSFRQSGVGETNPPIGRIELLLNNTNTGNLYSIKMLYGTGSAAGSAGGSGANRDFYDGASVASGATASTFSNVSYYIPNYAGSNNKSFSIDSVTENNGTAADASLTAGLFASSSAINRLTVQPYDGSNFVQYSTAYLYGVKNA
jgi:hypothetical protein